MVPSVPSPGPTLPNDATVPEKASEMLTPHISTSTKDRKSMNMYRTIYRKTDAILSSVIALLPTFVLNRELGCSLFWKSPHMALKDMYILSALIPPVVEPEHPQWIDAKIRIALARRGHDAVSACPNPVVVRKLTVWKVESRNELPHEAYPP